MEKELAPEVIKATQTSLGKYIKRPPLSEKLLKKPPFRFLHDVFTAVLKTNGLFEGLFEEEELISDNVKDRESKILFLNKVISVLTSTTGKNLSAKPSKIVAGQEPEKTNELLQCLAYALDKKLSTDVAVKKFKDNKTSQTSTDVKTKEKESSKVAKKNNDVKKLTSRSSEKLTSNKKETATVAKVEKVKTSDSKPKRRENGLIKNDSQAKKILNSKSLSKKPSEQENIGQPSSNGNKIEEHQLKIIKDKDTEQNEEIKVRHDALNKDPLETNDHGSENVTSSELNSPNVDQEAQGKLNSSYTVAENELNSSLSSRDLMENENDKIDESKTIDMSAIEHDDDTKSQDEIKRSNEEENFQDKKVDEKVALKIPTPRSIPKNEGFDSDSKAKELDKNIYDKIIKSTPNKQNPDIVRPQSVRPSSSRPGAPRLREKIDNIISENDNLILGKVNIIAENAQNEEEDDTSVIIVEQQAGLGSRLDDQQEQLQLSSNEHGHLVQQILDSQKEFHQVSGKTEIEWQFGAQKAKEALNQEIEQLRFNIQALSRVANPLGKLLDHIQEDVEVMRQELQQWTNVYEEVSKDMTKQKAASEETLVPLQTRIKQLDVDIEEKHDKINDLKILIHKNSMRIEKLLINGNVQ